MVRTIVRQVSLCRSHRYLILLGFWLPYSIFIHRAEDGLGIFNKIILWRKQRITAWSMTHRYALKGLDMILKAKLNSQLPFIQPARFYTLEERFITLPWSIFWFHGSCLDFTSHFPILFGDLWPELDVWNILRIDLLAESFQSLHCLLHSIRKAAWLFANSGRRKN